MRKPSEWESGILLLFLHIFFLVRLIHQGLLRLALAGAASCQGENHERSKSTATVLPVYSKCVGFACSSGATLEFRRILQLPLDRDMSGSVPQFSRL